MSKVYIVTAGQYSDYRIVGVFSSREKAEQLYNIDAYADTIDKLDNITYFRDGDLATLPGSKVESYISLINVKFDLNPILELELDCSIDICNGLTPNNLRNVNLYQCQIDCYDMNIYDKENDKDITIKKGDITTLPRLNVSTCLQCVQGVSHAIIGCQTLEILPDGRKIINNEYRIVIFAYSEKSQEHAEKLAVEARQKYERTLEKVKNG